MPGTGVSHSGISRVMDETGVSDWVVGLWAPQEKFGPAKGEHRLLYQEGKPSESIHVPLI